MSGAGTVILAGFPNPVGWVIDKVTGFVGGVATAGFEALIGGLAAWVTDAVVWVIGGGFNFFIDFTDPNVQADWFTAEDGPYGTMVVIGAVLLLLFLLAGITQGVLAGDVGGMLRRVALDLPVSVLGMVGLVTVTQALIRLTDELSTFVIGNFEDNIADFTAVVTSLSTLAGGGGGMGWGGHGAAPARGFRRGPGRLGYPSRRDFARGGRGVWCRGVFAAAGVSPAAPGRSGGRRPRHPGHAGARRHPGSKHGLLHPGPDRDAVATPGTGRGLAGDVDVAAWAARRSRTTYAEITRRRLAPIVSRLWAWWRRRCCTGPLAAGPEPA